MLLKGARIIDPKSNIDKVLDIRIENKIITKIAKNIEANEMEIILDFSGKIITPGLIDLHTHLREPGFTDKETIETGINAAIAGGYTAICPMANTKPCNDNVLTLKDMFKSSEKAKGIGFYPVCAVTKELQGEKIVNIKELKKLGAVAFSNDGKPIEDMTLLENILSYTRDLDVLVISHSEILELSQGGSINEGETSKKYGIKGIPTAVEYTAVAKELDIIRKTQAPYHFAHISTRKSIDLIRKAKAEGLKVTCETAPHYFTLTENDINPQNGIFKMNPPLRTQDDLEAVIEGLSDGTIDVIATDHAPHTIYEKNLPIEESPFGIVGLETALALTLALSGRVELPILIEKLTFSPAKILKLKNQGTIEIGKIANLTIIDPDLEWTVNAKNFKSKCKISPFEGKKLKGKAIGSFINGEFINLEENT
ncbi:MAG: dihydroorotase [Candidatus Gastranaerophilales bacterium]|nr:dihydroorotase [Candidatus Gastranaerophilales bacterium]